jgi:hypothetical protein
MPRAQFCASNEIAMEKFIEALIGQLLALIAFFAFPMLQYRYLKRFARNEGKPELWYNPGYRTFRLVI